ADVRPNGARRHRQAARHGAAPAPRVRLVTAPRRARHRWERRSLQETRACRPQAATYRQRKHGRHALPHRAPDCRSAVRMPRAAEAWRRGAGASITAGGTVLPHFGGGFIDAVRMPHDRLVAAERTVRWADAVAAAFEFG